MDAASYGDALPHRPLEKTATIRCLLSNGADVNARATHGSTTLLQAVAAGNHESVRLLLQAGADPNVSGQTGVGCVVGQWTPLSAATMNQDAEMIRLLRRWRAKR